MILDIPFKPDLIYLSSARPPVIPHLWYILHNAMHDISLLHGTLFIPYIVLCDTTLHATYHIYSLYD